jgi:transcription elongation factor Elf1
MSIIFYDDDYNEWTCQPCNRNFISRAAIDQHLEKSNVHDWCAACEREFPSQQALRNHRMDKHFFCDPCGILFSSRRALDDHDVEEHFLCRPCGRSFMNQNNLQQHMDSSVHKPKAMVCPMRGHGCSARFVSMSAAFLHCEQGRCPSGVTRQIMDRYIAERDRSGIITDPRRMLEGAGGEQRYPYTSEPTYSATERAWNGSAFECYFCHRTWPLLRSLNSHLGSGVHTQTQGLYHCPPQGCQATFSRFSALVQHIEHGGCGIRRFQYVERAIQGITSGMRSITAA